MCQARWCHTFTSVIKFGPDHSTWQGEQATEDQGPHNNFTLRKSDPTNSGAHLTLEKFSFLS